MTTNTNLSGYTRFLIDLAQIAEEQAPRIEQTALLGGMASLKRRVFNDGEDSNDRPIGKKANKKASDKFKGDYTARYYETGRRPRGAGDKKNLNIDGSHFRNDIQIGKSGDSNTFGFINEDSALIAVGQEEIHDKAILDPTDNEVEEVINEYVDGVFDLIEKSLRSIGR